MLLLFEVHLADGTSRVSSYLIIVRKYDVSVDYDAYERWHSQHSAHATVNGDSNLSHVSETSGPLDSDVPTTIVADQSEASAPYPMSFNHVVDLITKGESIPGIKEIPDTVLEGQASQSTTGRRQKPWEKVDARPESEG